jgi:predicted amidohydrolase YtcJ
MTVLPGLFDAHAHVMPTGFFLNSADLTDVGSISDVLDILQRECLSGGDGWVIVYDIS